MIYSHVHKKHTHDKLIRDCVFIAVSIFLTIFALRIGMINEFISFTQGLGFISSFFAGLFFTSVFTIAPASILLVKISQTTPLFFVSFWGGLGAMISDIFLFLFIRDSIAEDIQELMSPVYYKKIKSLFKLRIFRWLLPLLGALVIISPLPDELGLAMMGMSKMPVSLIAPISFTMNFLGILLLCFVFHLV